MDKKQYIKRQLSKTNKKDYENYVVTRIIHKIDDLDIKFVTQQYVKRPSGYALADLYFPQINYFVEIDEFHHLTHRERDKVRDADFVDMTGAKPKRIKVSKRSIEQINKATDRVVKQIRRRIEKQKKKRKFVLGTLIVR